MSRSINRLLPWVPVLLAGIYLVALVASQGMVRASLNSHADFASTPVIAELMGRADAGRTIILGDYPWYEALWLLRGTAWLPNHEFVWQLIPFALWLATAALAGAAVWRASSAWAGAVTASLIVCGGVAMRQTLWSLNTHGPIAVHVALLGAALVAALLYPRWQRGPRGYGGAVVIGLITAVGATDPLLLPLGIGPLLLAAFALWLRRDETALLRLAVLVSAIGVVGAKILAGWATDAGITWTNKAVKFIDVGRLVDQIGLLPGAVARLVSTNPFGAEVETTTVIAMVGTLAGMIAAVTVSVTGVRLSKRTLWPQRFGRSAAGTARGGRTESAVVAGLVFWLAVLAANVLAFLFTGAAFDVNGARYLVSGWVAVAVLIPLLAERLELRWLGATVATTLCFSATYAFVDEPRPTFEAPLPSEQLASVVRQFGAQHGASRGYAGFWDSMPITWHTRFATELYPVYTCNRASGANCRFYQHQISSWYTPKPGRTMLVIDDSQPLQPVLDKRYGKPIATKRFGPVAVYVFDHDIAEELADEFG